MLNRLDTKEYQQFRLFVHSVQQASRRIKKIQFQTGNRVRISKYDLPLRTDCKPQFCREFFEIVPISSRQPPTYAMKNEQDAIIRGKPYQKNWWKSINNGIVCNKVGFQMHLCNFFQTLHSSLFQFFLPEQLDLEGQWEVAISEISYPSICQIITGGKLISFGLESFQICLTFSIWNRIFPFFLWILLKPWTLSFKDTITAKTISPLKWLAELKSLRFTFHMKVLVLPF